MTAPLVRVLLDTNVISEVTRPRPSAEVLAYLAALPPLQAHLSLITIGEIESGLQQAEGARAVKLRNWLEGQVLPRYAGRVLPLDEAVIRRWGELMALPAVRAHNKVVVDAMIAATASVHRLTVVTRNVADFSLFPVASYTPWEYNSGK